MSLVEFMAAGIIFILGGIIGYMIGINQNEEIPEEPQADDINGRD